MDMIGLAIVTAVMTYLTTFKSEFDQEKLGKAFLFMLAVGVAILVLAIISA